MLQNVERNTLLAAKKVLTLEDVALLTGISKSYLYKMTYRKELPYYKPNGKLIYFDRKEVEEWMLQNRVCTNAEAERKAVVYVARKGGLV